MSATLVKGAPLRTVKHVVIGFAFDTMGRVLMVNKNKPSWQIGQWNGVGGKVEPNENIDRAMAREFFEETGILIAISEWFHFADVGHSGDFMVHCYVAGYNKKWVEFDANGYKQNFPDANDIGEKLGAYFVHSLDILPLVVHTRWLAHLALDTLHNGATHFTSMEVDL